MARYSTTDIAHAISAYKASGLSIKAAADKLGVNYSTLRSWIKDAANKSIEIKQLERKHASRIARKSLGLADRAMDLTTDEDIKNAPLAARMSAVKNMIDIAQILDGEPTSITAQVMSEEQRLEAVLDLAKIILERQKQALLPAPAVVIDVVPETPSVEGDQPPSDEAAAVDGESK